MTPNTRTGRHAVFATARFPQERLAAMQVGQGNASLVHAKTMGTMTTLCGESTFSWFKFWDMAFTNVLLERCPQCSSAFVTRPRAGERQ